MANREISIKYKPITPQNTIVTFDLHDVIVNYDYWEIAKTIFKHKKKLKLFIALLNPFVWWSIIKLMYKNAVAEQYIFEIGQKHKSLEPYIPLGVAVANCQTINPNMVQLIKKLKDKGYALHLYSNVGTKIFTEFTKKFPGIFDHFDKIILPSEENGYLRKPHHQSFINYLKNNQNDRRQIIFIDDKKRNIKKAAQYGIIGIQFKCYCQLVKRLKKMGIL
ncbi:HAD hydrolase-like protein [Candidatus Dependentiae bacterium]